MLEFLTALFVYLGVLFSMVSSTSEINILTEQIDFTVVVNTGQESSLTRMQCREEYYNFLPIEYRGEFLKDATCYSAPNLSGQRMELPIGTIIQLTGISESGRVLTFWKNSERWYVASQNVDIISDEVLGIPVEQTIDIDAIPDFFVATSEECDVAFAYGLYNMLPPYIQKAFENTGYKIIVTDTDLQEMFERDAPVAGITVHGEKVIYIYNTSSSIKYSLYHEIGHVLDNFYGKLSTQDEFLEIFEEEKDFLKPIGNFVDGYQKTSSQEYFAVTFQNIMLSGMLEEDTAPRTYEYVWRFICKMKKNTL